MADSARRERDVYGLLIVAMLASAPLEAVVGEGSVLVRLFWGLLPMLAALSLFRQRVSFAVALSLALVALVLTFGTDVPWTGPYAGALASAFTTAVLLGRVFAARPVTGETVSAALCVYLLIGVTFAMVYRGLSVEPLGDVAAFVTGSGAAAGPSDMGYFSFVTLTTLGYGDVLPNSELARSLAIVEALLGQLYLVAVVASVVGRRVSGGGA